MQLDHFGAFYRGSWRANDWMWGRIDGAGWLVHVLLAPARLIELRDQSSDPPSYAAVFLKQLQSIVGQPPPDEVNVEIADLFNATTATPPSLPKTSMWVAGIVQQSIAAEELASVALQLQLDGPDIPRNSDESAFLSAFRKATGITSGPIPDPPPIPKTDDAAGLLVNCNVSRETILSQKDSPLFVRTSVKAAAVGVAAVGAADSKPPAVVVPVLKLARLGTRAAYEIVNSVTRGRDLQTVAAAIAVLALGVGLVTSDNAFVNGLGAVALAAGVVLSLAVLRPVVKWVAVLVLVAASIAALLAAYIPTIRKALFPASRRTRYPGSPPTGGSGL